MRSTYLIAGAIVLALVAAGVLFGTDFFRKNPLGHAPSVEATSDDAQMVARMSEIAAGAGFVATFSQKDGNKWLLAQGHRLERFSLDGADVVFARLTSQSPLVRAPTQWESQGLSITLPVEFAQRSNGHRIQVGIVARSAPANGSSELNILYATQQAGNGGWNAIKVSQRFQLQTFDWFVPRVEEGYHSNPIVVVHADAAGEGRAVEILGIYVKIVQ